MDSDFIKTAYSYCDSCEGMKISFYLFFFYLLLFFLVHKGFYDAFLDVKDQIVAGISKL